MKNDDTTPATKTEVSSLNAKIEQMRSELIEEHETTRRHFDTVAEQMWHDLHGAQKDEREVLKDRVNRHDKRLTRIEDHLELIV